MVKDVKEYHWSSAMGHIESGSDPILSYDSPLDVDIRDWRGYLREADDGKLVEDILKNGLTGRPCGDEGFIAKIEGLLGRELKANPQGRPWHRKGAI